MDAMETAALGLLFLLAGCACAEGPVEASRHPAELDGARAEPCSGACCASSCSPSGEASLDWAGRPGAGGPTPITASDGRLTATPSASSPPETISTPVKIVLGVIIFVVLNCLFCWCSQIEEWFRCRNEAPQQGPIMFNMDGLRP